MIDYRKDIDCLRGYAVLAVIFYHLKIENFKGGYLGVDIFFVISGYLITLIILDKIKNNIFSFIDFYERRIRRILPTLYFVIIISTIVQIQFLLPNEKINIFKTILSILFFSSNYYFFFKGSYFNPENEDNLLQHTWSLSVEEQFYLIFPILLYFLYKKKFLFFLVPVFFVSFFLANNGGIFSYRYPYYDSFNLISIPDFSFYFAITRAWELLAGSFVAITISYLNLNFNYKKFYYLRYFGYFLIFLSLYFFDKNTPHPSVYTLIPIIGVIAIILINNKKEKKNFLEKVINNNYIWFIGLISYSLYLWHLPVLSIYKNLSGPFQIKLQVKLLLLIIIFFLSVFTYYFIEKNFRNKKFLTKKKIFLLFSALSFTLIIFCLINIYLVDHYKKIDNKLIKILNERNYYKNSFFNKCLSGKSNYISPDNSCLLGNNSSPKYAFLGDSHMGILAEEMNVALSKTDDSGYLFSYTGCLPSLNLQIVNDKKYKCHKYYSDVYNFLKNNSSISTIILFYRWPFYFNGRFDNLEGGVEYGTEHVVDSLTMNKKIILNTDKLTIIENNISDYFSKLYSLNKNFIIIFSTPEMGWEIPELLVKKIIKDGEKKVGENHLSIDRKIYFKRNSNVYNFFQKMSKDYNLKIIYPHKLFCPKERCLAHINNYPLYYDDDHLSSFGAKLLSNYIIKEIN